MKKIILSIACFALGFFMWANPTWAEEGYAPDAIITNVTFEAETAQTSANTSYTFSFTAGATMPKYTTIYVVFYDSEDALMPDELGMDFTLAEFNSTTLGEFTTGYRDAARYAAFIQLDEEHSAGEYSFTMDNITNPDDVMSLYPTLSTDTWSSAMARTAADVFELSLEAETLDTSDTVSSLDVEAETLEAGATGDLTFYFDIMASLGYGDAFFLGFVNEDGDSPMDSGFDFGSSSYVTDMPLLCEPVDELNDAVLYCMAYSTVDPNGYDLTVLNVVNPSVADSYTALITFDAEMEPTSEYVNCPNELVITGGEEEEEASAPNKPKKKKFKVKDKKKRSAILWWKSQSKATYYKVRLERYKPKKEKYAKYKLYKNVTNNKKKLKKAKKILKSQTKYRFKVRACNEAGCSVWSKYKKFKTN